MLRAVQRRVTLVVGGGVRGVRGVHGTGMAWASEVVSSATAMAAVSAEQSLLRETVAQIPSGWKGMRRFYDSVGVRGLDAFGEPLGEQDDQSKVGDGGGRCVGEWWGAGMAWWVRGARRRIRSKF
jgi:hypothetical protein